MKINEVEKELIIPRASIRFYEKEGFLTPQRAENGYREYSDADIATLKEIVIFRKLGMSLNTIRNTLNGQIPLQDALNECLFEIQARSENLAQTKEFCNEMQKDGVSIQNFDIDKYWLKFTTNDKLSNVDIPIAVKVLDDMYSQLGFEVFFKERQSSHFKRGLLLFSCYSLHLILLVLGLMLIVFLIQGSDKFDALRSFKIMLSLLGVFPAVFTLKLFFEKVHQRSEKAELLLRNGFIFTCYSVLVCSLIPDLLSMQISAWLLLALFVFAALSELLNKYKSSSAAKV